MNNFKQFTTFEDGITELCKLVPDVTKYTKYTKTEQEVSSKLMECIKDNYPTVYSPEYPATYSLSISAREVGFKTRSFFAFGWKILISPKDNTVTYGFRISFSDFKNIFNNKTEELLATNGWASIPTIKRDIKKPVATKV